MVVAMKHTEMRRANLRKITEQLGSNKALAEALNASQAQITNLIGKHPIRNIGEAFARRVEEAFHLPRGWLEVEHDVIDLSGYAVKDGKKTNNQVRLSEKLYVYLPVVNLERSNESGQLIYDEGVDKEIAFPRFMTTEWKLNMGEGCIIKALDDSMMTLINPGDLLVVNLAANVAQDGRCYLIKLDGRFLIRRLYKDRDDIDVSADNQYKQLNYPKKRINLAQDKDRFTVVGQIVAKVGAFL